MLVYRMHFYTSLQDWVTLCQEFFYGEENLWQNRFLKDAFPLCLIQKKILKNSFCSYPFPFGVINRTCIAAGWIAILVECYSSDPWLSPTRLLGGDQWTIYLKDKRTNGWFILIPAGQQFPQAIMELLQPWRQQPLFLLQAGTLIEKGTLRAIGRLEGKQWAPQALW